VATRSQRPSNLSRRRCSLTLASRCPFTAPAGDPQPPAAAARAAGTASAAPAPTAPAPPAPGPSFDPPPADETGKFFADPLTYGLEGRRIYGSDVFRAPAFRPDGAYMITTTDLLTQLLSDDGYRWAISSCRAGSCRTGQGQHPPAHKSC
jgi:hypothetical protein